MVGIWFNGHDDPVRYVLQRPLEYEPGKHFIYSGGNMFILGEIITNSSGMDLDKFSEKYLFEPLGISSFDWWIRYENGFIDTASGLKMTPRDMLKIGITFLDNGYWDGRQILSEKWVEKSSSTYSPNTGINIPGEDLGRVGYAYTWWTKELEVGDSEVDGYWANGWGGQKIMILPEKNSVIVFTGGNFNSKVHNLKILEKYIFPVVG
jgi:CubicO group peptidase (beta-lactamase class C family)